MATLGQLVQRRLGATPGPMRPMRTTIPFSNTVFYHKARDGSALSRSQYGKAIRCAGSLGLIVLIGVVVLAILFAPSEADGSQNGGESLLYECHGSPCWRTGTFCRS